jgi:hypothetical protein
MPTTCEVEATRALSELQQLIGAFMYRGKAHPPKSLLQVGKSRSVKTNHHLALTRKLVEMT